MYELEIAYGLPECPRTAPHVTLRRSYDYCGGIVGGIRGGGT